MSDFATDVKAGLTSHPKQLLSKYFYDAEGSRIFQQIMQLDVYYPTNKEYEILETHKDTLLQHFQSKGIPFDLIELGAGDGLKTKILLAHYVAQQAEFRYSPIDISQSALVQLEQELHDELPEVHVHAQAGDYFTALGRLQHENGFRKVLLFMGGNIGNFSAKVAKAFLCQINQFMDPGDLIVMGIDLRKNPRVILQAYDDPEGVTREFNLNLLRRINRELGANFQVDQFTHYPFYNIETGEVRSYLVSKIQQEVYISALELSIQFDAWEYIHTEISKKYTIPEIEQLAHSCGFEVEEHLYDQDQYFVNSIWSK